MSQDDIHKKINDLNHKLTMAAVAPPQGKMTMGLTSEAGRQKALREMRQKFMKDLADKNPKFKNVLESFQLIHDLSLQKVKLMDEALWTKALLLAVREDTHE